MRSDAYLYGEMATRMGSIGNPGGDLQTPVTPKIEETEYLHGNLPMGSTIQVNDTETGNGNEQTVDASQVEENENSDDDLQTKTLGHLKAEYAKSKRCLEEMERAYERAQRHHQALATAMEGLENLSQSTP